MICRFIAGICGTGLVKGKRDIGQPRKVQVQLLIYLDTPSHISVIVDEAATVGHPRKFGIGGETPRIQCTVSDDHALTSVSCKVKKMMRNREVHSIIECTYRRHRSTLYKLLQDRFLF